MSLAAAPQPLLSIPLPPLDSVESSVAEQLRQARRQIEEATAKRVTGKDLADAYGTLARLYHAYEFFDASESAYLNAVRVAPQNATWLHLLGYLYQQTGRPQEAAEKYIAALRVDPADHPAHVHLGEVYLQLNRPREARDEFQKVAMTFPGAASKGLGEVALREGRFVEAIEHLRAALARVPQATSIHYSLAMAYRGLGRMGEARSHLERRGGGGIRAVDPIIEELPKLVRGERVLMIQGTRAYEAGQFQDAASAFSQALAANPSSVAARVNLGLTQSRLGRVAEATEHFEAALRLDADNLTAHASLGMILARQGRDSVAADHLRATFEQSPDDINVREELIGALLRLGRTDDAIGVLTRARSIDPDEEGSIVSLSIVLSHRERYREAVVLLEDAHRRFPERTATATTLARLLASSPDISLRDGRRALELAMTVYDSEPTPAHAETVALALAELGRCDEAAKWLRRGIAEAERARDAEEVARLKGEMPKYESATCRPPEQVAWRARTAGLAF